MISHAITWEARTWWGWPSMQKASQMLAQRIAAADMNFLRIAA